MHTYLVVRHSLFAHVDFMKGPVRELWAHLTEFIGSNKTHH